MKGHVIPAHEVSFPICLAQKQPEIKKKKKKPGQRNSGNLCPFVNDRSGMLDRIQKIKNECDGIYEC